MTFAAPLLLLALLPWLAVTWWVWRRRGASTTLRVPFLHLWPQGLPTPEPNRPRRPPWVVLLLLLAALLAILAAAGPTVSPALGGSRLHATLIIDRGPSTIAGGGLIDAANRLDGLLRAEGIEPEFHVITVPAGENQDLEAPVDFLGETQPLLRRAVASALRTNEGPMIVLSAESVEEDPRVLVVGPEEARPNVAVEFVGPGFETDPPQVLVRIRSDAVAAAEVGELKVQTAEGFTATSVALPPPDDVLEVVLDLPDAVAMSDVLTIELRVEGDVWAADNMRRVALTRAWPNVEVGQGVPATVERLAEVYWYLRPPMPWSKRIFLSSQALPAGVTGIQIADATRMIEPGTVQAADTAPQALAALLDWNALAGLRSAAPPDDGWEPVVSASDTWLLAVRPSGAARQVWVGFDAETWQATVEFVRFWSDLLTWINGGDPAWEAAVAERMSELGVHRDESGRPVARNVPAVSLAAPRELEESAARAWMRHWQQGREIRAEMAVLAMACTAVACLGWGRGWG